MNRPRPLKILLSAYACEPWRGSEPDVGFQTMLTLASYHQVWVITRANNIDALRKYLATDDRSENITLIGIDLGPLALRLKRLGLLGQIWYYDRWQKLAGARAVQVSAEVDFDLAYHITFAAYWMRTGVAEADLPLIVGPIGGGVEPPLRLAGVLGIKGQLEDAARVLGRRLMARRPSVRLGPRKASQIFVNNPQTGERLRRITDAPIEVLPNPTAIKVPEDLAPRTPNDDIFFVARLVPWKGAALAIRAMRHVETPGARLVLNGDGPDRKRLESLVRKWDLEGRVTFAGQVPRDDLLRGLSEAGVLIHPALHEEGGNAVAEALSMHVPVVCIARGGPSVTVTLFPYVPSAAVPISDPDTTAREIAAALDTFLAEDGERPAENVRAKLDYQETILEAIARVGGR